jgi:hypothetical protein
LAAAIAGGLFFGPRHFLLDAGLTPINGALAPIAKMKSGLWYCPLLGPDRKTIMPEDIEAYCAVWTGQNVGSGPLLTKQAAETRALAGDLIVDARHAGYTEEDIESLSCIATRIVRARAAANQRGSADWDLGGTSSSAAA